ncbi:hypothetical protein F4826_004756 [Rahnella inusitata]|nr:hypothetical protein [Rahnella inusitata]
MKLKNLFLVSVVVLSGCTATASDYAYLNPGSKFAEGNCKATFHVKSFAVESKPRLNIEMLRKDHVGNEYVKVKRGQAVHFNSLWIPAYYFSDLSCDNKSEALFAKL